METVSNSAAVVEVKDLRVSYGPNIVLESVDLRVAASEIRVILGTSGCGKTTLLKAMVGLLKPERGVVKLFGKEIGEPDAPDTLEALKHVGILFQNGALLGSLTVGENIALPLQMHTSLSKKLIREIVELKLTQVDLPGVYSMLPQELSGGMRKRAALARALVLDPPLVFCDEPSAGLDPINARKLDDLILELRDGLGATVVIITHELASIFAIGNNSVFLDEASKSIIATGDPKALLANSKDPRVIQFLTRGLPLSAAGRL